MLISLKLLNMPKGIRKRRKEYEKKNEKTCSAFHGSFDGCIDGGLRRPAAAQVETAVAVTVVPAQAVPAQAEIRRSCIGISVQKVPIKILSKLL